MFRKAIFLLLGLLIGSELLDESLAIDINRTVQLCGNHLTLYLKYYCRGIYPTMMPNKRSNQLIFDFFNPENLGMTPNEDTMMLDYEDNAIPTRLMSGRRNHRLRRGITDECCKKPCSLDVLSEFCG